MITAAEGSVGGWAVQFAAAAGAGAVVAVDKVAKEMLVKGLGATEVVDYTKVTVDPWAADHLASREVDLVIDCIGGPTMRNLWSALEEGGSCRRHARLPVLPVFRPGTYGTRSGPPSGSPWPSP